MILTVQINRREADELWQAVGDHKLSLERHGIVGRAKNAESLLAKLAHAEECDRTRP